MTRAVNDPMKWKALMTSRRLLSAATLVALALALSACGSSGSSSSAPQRQEGTGGFGNGGAGGPGGPSGSGKVAAVSGRTAQVQGTAGQVAVSWTAQTRFTQQVAAKASELRVGDCVVAMPATPSASASPGAASTTIAAATVRITAASGGSCAVGRGFGGGGTPPSGRPSRQAGEAPSGAPSGGPNRRGGFGAFGEVASVDGPTFAVKQVRPGSTSSSSVTVTTTGTTTWTTLTSAAAKDVKVGRCVVSQGPTNSTGAVTAASIVISQPVNGQCTSGFGGGRFRSGGQGQTS
jgi:hypothetical protein